MKTNYLWEFFKLIRPPQWVKNTFIFAPLIFAQKLYDYNSLLKAILAFAAFCALSSSIYILNDLRDIELDKKHPYKKNRPLASGKFPASLARTIWPIMATLSLAILLLFLNFQSFLIGVGYLVLNISYSLYLKRLPYIDVMSISLGFVLRVLVGVTAIEVEISYWLLPCTFALSLYLALGKRRHELAAYTQDKNKKTRPVLDFYDLQKLDFALAVTSALTVLAYCGYTLDPQTLKKFQTPYLIYTIPMIVFGIVRFLQLVERRPHSESPTQELLRDIPSIINVMIWVGAVIFILYYQPGKNLLSINNCESKNGIQRSINRATTQKLPNSQKNRQGLLRRSLPR